MSVCAKSKEICAYLRKLNVTNVKILDGYEYAIGKLLLKNIPLKLGFANIILGLNMPNPLSPYDALKHHFTSLKTDVIFLQQMAWNENFRGTG